jgi:hypothetical protein
MLARCSDLGECISDAGAGRQIGAVGTTRERQRSPMARSLAGCGTDRSLASVERCFPASSQRLLSCSRAAKSEVVARCCNREVRDSLDAAAGPQTDGPAHEQQSDRGRPRLLLLDRLPGAESALPRSQIEHVGDALTDREAESVRPVQGRSDRRDRGRRSPDGRNRLQGSRSQNLPLGHST